MSHVHVKINFSFGIDSWNRCPSVHKRLQIRAQFANPSELKGIERHWQRVQTNRKQEIIDQTQSFFSFMNGSRSINQAKKFENLDLYSFANF
jgi:hypothetical protein